MFVILRKSSEQKADEEKNGCKYLVNKGGNEEPTQKRIAYVGKRTSAPNGYS